MRAFELMSERFKIEKTNFDEIKLDIFPHNSLFHFL